MNVEGKLDISSEISVVMCAHTMDRLDDIHEAVQSVLAQRIKPQEIVISIDHNEELYELLKDQLAPEVKVVLNTGAPGVSETRSNGIRHAKGSILVFIDDDVTMEPDWLESLLEPLKRPDVAIVGGKSTPVWPVGKRPRWFPEELDWMIGGTYRGMPVSDNNEIRNALTCNMACKKEVFDTAGLFDPDIGAVDGLRRGGEEAEFCLRVKRIMPEMLILYEPKAVVYHKVPCWRSSLKYLVKRSFQEGYSKVWIKKLSKNSKALSIENSYARYLLFRAIPTRLLRFYKLSNLTQAAAIITSGTVVAAGYTWAKLRS